MLKRPVRRRVRPRARKAPQVSRFAAMASSRAAFWLLFCGFVALHKRWTVDESRRSWHTGAVRLAIWRRRTPHMSMQSHLAELEKRHRALEAEISEALAHPSTDDLKIAELKRRKLHVKDEIARLQHEVVSVH